MSSLKVIDTISPDKDVDGFHVINAGKLAVGLEGIVPCTPLGSLMLLKDTMKTYSDTLSGKHAVIVGRTNIVGKPMAQLLLAEDCTVTIAHSKTRNLQEICLDADILVAAVGRPRFIPGDWIKEGAYVIDVGINRIQIEGADGPKSKLVGDVDFRKRESACLGHYAGAERRGPDDDRLPAQQYAEGILPAKPFAYSRRCLMSAGVVIIGAGHAGGATAGFLRQYGYAHAIKLIGAESYLPYQRPPLSKAWLKGEASLDDLYLRGDSYYSDQNIETRTNIWSNVISPQSKTIVVESGESIAYDHLIIATGSKARPIAIKGIDRVPHHLLRTLDDAEALKNAMRPGRHIGLIGAGYIGLEVAASARHIGCEVTLFEREARHPAARRIAATI